MSGGATTLHTNDGTITITSGPSSTSAPAAGTVETWTGNVQLPLPAASTGLTQYFLSDPLAPTEKILVTAATGTTGSPTLTVVRGADGTSPVPHGLPGIFRVVAVAGFLNSLKVVIPATGDTTGTKDTAATVAAAAALASTGGTIEYGPGAFYINSASVTIDETGQAIFVKGQGNDATRLFIKGSGDGIRMLNPTFPSGGFTSLAVYGGGVAGLTFDGSLASSGAVGLHIGDGEHYHVDCQFQHFNGTGSHGPLNNGSVGLWIDNTVWWTEKGEWNAVFIDCTNCVLQTNNSGFNSNAENNYRWTFFISANQNAITMVGIAHYLGRLECRGVFNAGVSNTGVFLTADASSAINNCHLDIAVNSGSTGTFHTTANVATGFSFQSNFGRMLFNLGPWQAGNWGGGNWAGNQTAFSFAGDILGDTGVSPAAFASGNGPPQIALILAGTPVAYAQGFLRGSDGKMNDFMGDFFACTLSASITVGLGASGTKGSVPGPQRKLAAITQAASGGPYTVSWPTSGSPSTTTPNVTGPGGGPPPAMLTAAGAVQVYQLHTFDGATWICTVLAPSPAPSVNYKPSAPTGTASATGVMMGLGATCTYTPAGSGKVIVTVKAVCCAVTAAVGATVGGRYGTGSAPANAASITGTTFDVDSQVRMANINSAVGSTAVLTDRLSLTPGTAYWFDLALTTGTSGDTVQLQYISVTIAEQLA